MLSLLAEIVVLPPAQIVALDAEAVTEGGGVTVCITSTLELSQFALASDA